MRAPRSVTLQPTGRPWRSLKDAMAFFALVTSGFWPVQRAELRGPTKTIYGAVLIRPGVEIRAFCSGSPNAAAYDSIFASLAHPNDTTWQQQAEQQRTQREAHNAEVTAQQQAQQQQQGANNQQQQQEQPSERRRRNRDPANGRLAPTNGGPLRVLCNFFTIPAVHRP
mgnify:CR=1 FL=1